MANDRWRGSDDAAWDAPEADRGAPAAPDESIETLRAERDTRAREAAESHDRYLRTLAEFENFRRRTARERDDWRRQAQEALLREILPVLDDFERALAAPSAPDAEPAFRTGVELIHRNFLTALERLGVRPFEAVGQPFDPTRHEAVGRVERADVDDETVVAEPLRGYLFQDRVLRPAQVVVAKHPPSAASGGEGAA
jgi:molecular chaperone GrpE